MLNENPNSEQNSIEPDQGRKDETTISRSLGDANHSFGHDAPTKQFRTEPGFSAPRAWPRIPGYVIEGTLGEGGMGIVYRARNVTLDRLVAIKMLLPGVHADTDSLRRFAVEIEAISKLQHRNIIQILDAGAVDSQPFFVMEFVDGNSLGQKLAAEEIKPATSASLMIQLADGIQFAHQNGVIHRDLKPGNILIAADGVAKIMDFGIAKRSDLIRDLTATGVILGTPGYLAPEQAAGRNSKVGPASDIFSLGVILYEMLTGRRPFDDLSEVVVMRRIVHEDPPPPRWIRPGIPKDLETICLKCLEKQPAKRYETAGELKADLERFVGGNAIVARPASPIDLAVKWLKRNPVKSAALVTTLVLIVASVVGLVWHNRQLSQSLNATRRLADLGGNFSSWVLNQHLKELDSINGSADAKAKLVNKVQRFLDQSSQQTNADAESQRQIAMAYMRLAGIQGDPFGDNLGQYSEAITNYRRAIELLEAALPRTSDPDAVRLEIANCSVDLAELLRNHGDARNARNLIDAADKTLSQLEKSHEVDRDRVNDIRIRFLIGRVKLANQVSGIDEENVSLDEIQRLVEDLPDSDRYSDRKLAFQAWVLGNRSQRALQTGDRFSAQQHAAEQLSLYQRQLQQRSKNLRVMARVANATIALAEIHDPKTDSAKARDLCITAASVCREALQIDPLGNDFKLTLCAALRTASLCSSSLNEFEQALTEATEAASVARSLIAAAASDEYRCELCRALQVLAQAAWAAGKTDSAVSSLREAYEIARAITAADPENIDRRRLHGLICRDFAARLLETREKNETSEINSSVPSREDIVAVLKDGIASLDIVAADILLNEQVESALESMRTQLNRILQ